MKTYGLWGYVKCLETCINFNNLVKARNDEEDSRANCRATLNATQSEDDGSLVLRDDFDNEQQRKRKCDNYQDDGDECKHCCADNSSNTRWRNLFCSGFITYKARDTSFKGREYLS